MNCHSCPHHEAILRGEYNSKPWNELPCATCKLREDTFYSIPFDEENPPQSIAGVSPASRPYSDHCSPTYECLLPAATLAQFVQGFLTLPPEQRDVVAWRYQGVPYREIATRQGTSIQLAEMRHKIAIRDWPVLKSLFPLKTAKRKRHIASKS